MDFVRSHIMVCTGTGCSSSKSPEIIERFEEELKAQGMDKEVKVVKTGCFGLCAMGPIVLIYPEGALYTHVTVDDVKEIVSEHIVKGRIVERLLHKEEEDKEEENEEDEEKTPDAGEKEPAGEGVEDIQSENASTPAKE